MRLSSACLALLGAGTVFAALAPQSALAADTSIHVTGTVLMECRTAHLGMAGYTRTEACLQFSPGGAASVQYNINNSSGLTRGYDVVYEHANLTLVLNGEERQLAHADRFTTGVNYTEFGNWEYDSGVSGDAARLYYEGPNGYVQQGIYSDAAPAGGWLDDNFQLVPGYTPRVDIIGGIDKYNQWNFECTFIPPDRGQRWDASWENITIGTGPCGNDAVDTDSDGVEDGLDNCPATANADQADNDGEGTGDACDLCPTDPANTDVDDDLVCDVNDACLGDNATGDDDQDGWCDDQDLCFGTDVLGDVDADGWCEDEDNCPVDDNAGQSDADDDGIGDACEADSDQDGVIDDDDNCAATAHVGQADGDSDGQGDACDDDDDDDGAADDSDNCPVVANSTQVDFDSDGLGDACDGDDDADAVADDVDQCAATPLSALVSDVGCSGEQHVVLTCGTLSNWTNRGGYVSCVTTAVQTARAQGLLTGNQGGVIVSTAAKSGKK